MIEVVKNSVTHPLTPFQAKSLSLFLAVAEGDPDFDSVVSCFDVPTCGLWLTDGTDVPCLAVAYIAELNAWSICDSKGRVRQYLDGEVQ